MFNFPVVAVVCAEPISWTAPITSDKIKIGVKNNIFD
jgi:hypothetical protein